MKPLKIGASGDEVTRLQVALNARSDSRGLPKVAVDGELGPVTFASVQRVARALGALESTLGEARKSGVVSVGLQRLVRYPEGRTQDQLRRAKDRAVAERKRESLLSLRERAYREADRLVGVMERGGNNRGAEVEDIIHEGGGLPGQAWCGWFMAAVYKRAGSRAVEWRWGAVRLMALVSGVRRTQRPKRGDLVRFTFDHVGMFVRDNGDGTITTIEGNTGRSGAVSDSKTGGDGVYRKVRSKSLVRDYLEVTR